MHFYILRIYKNMGFWIFILSVQFEIFFSFSHTFLSFSLFMYLFYLVVFFFMHLFYISFHTFILSLFLCIHFTSLFLHIHFTSLFPFIRFTSLFAYSFYPENLQFFSILSWNLYVKLVFSKALSSLFLSMLHQIIA